MQNSLFNWEGYNRVSDEMKEIQRILFLAQGKVYQLLAQYRPDRLEILEEYWDLLALELKYPSWK